MSRITEVIGISTSWISLTQAVEQSDKVLVILQFELSISAMRCLLACLFDANY